MKEIDHEYTDEIICPYCGYEYSDSFEFGGGVEWDDEMTCDDCGKIFHASCSITTTYSTEKDCELMEEGHDYTDDPKEGDNHLLGSKSETGLTYMKCLTCEKTAYV